MLSTSSFFTAMMPLYIMALIGFISRKVEILPIHANHVITQLMLYITLPSLILYSLNTTISEGLLRDFIWLIIMSVSILSISILIAAWLRKKSSLPTKQKSVYESLIIFGNQGFIGFAVAFILLAEEGIIYLTIFNICYLILIWTYGIYIFTKSESLINWKGIFLNSGILATMLGLIMLFSPYEWPSPILNTFETVGKVTIPLSMILIGSLLAEIKWDDLWNYSRNIYIWIASCCKLLIIPSFLIIFLYFNVPYPLIVIAVLTSAMPSATTTSVYAKKYGGDVSFASFGVLLTTMLCLLTIPLLYTVLQWLYFSL